MLLLTFNTVIHNAQVKLDSSVDIHNNELVQHVFTFRNFNVLSVLYVCMLLCLSVCLSVFIVPFLPVYYFSLGMLPEIKLI